MAVGSLPLSPGDVPECFEYHGTIVAPDNTGAPRTFEFEGGLLVSANGVACERQDTPSGPATCDNFCRFWFRCGDCMLAVVQTFNDAGDGVTGYVYSDPACPEDSPLRPLTQDLPSSNPCEKMVVPGTGGYPNAD